MDGRAYRHNGKGIMCEDQLTLADAITAVRGWRDQIRSERNASEAS